MAIQTDLDRLLISWGLFRTNVNARIPSAQDKIWKVQIDLLPPGAPKPGPTKQ